MQTYQTIQIFIARFNSNARYAANLQNKICRHIFAVANGYMLFYT